MASFDVIDTETLCALLGKTDRTIRTWVNEGMPSKKEGRTTTYYWPDVLAWYVDRMATETRGMAGEFAPDEEAEDEKESLRTATLRKTRAEADLKQLALSKMRGEVIDIASAKERLDRMFGNLRTQLLGMAPKLATRLAGERDPSKQEATIKDEMEMLARDLSSGSIVTTVGEEETADIQASAADAGPVIDDEVRAVCRLILADEIGALTEGYL